MQDLRNANIPFETVSRILEQTRMEPSLAKPVEEEQPQSLLGQG